MSSKLRNPFRMRASERIESDTVFLRLYSPLSIETLIESNVNGAIWNNVIFIRSSPGGGKTSLLRIFEPNSLLAIYSRRSQEYKELYNYLKKIDVIHDDGVQLMGIPLTCTRNYELLEDLKLSDGLKARIFYALINARITLSTLKSILEFRKLKFPEGLNEIDYIYPNEDNYLKNLITPCKAIELYHWALETEKKVFNILDAFIPDVDSIGEGHDEPFSFFIFKPEYFIINNKPICEKILFMLDDAHKLSINQRSGLIKYLIEKRGRSNLWISERTEIIEPIENLGSSIQRDYEEINLENYWQGKPGKFEKVLINIAEKRARMSTEDVNNFQENLETNFDEELIKTKLNHFIESTQSNIEKITSFYGTKFSLWLEYNNKFVGSNLDKALLVKKLEILISRNLGKPQFAFDFPLIIDELLDKLDQPLEEAAKFFLCQAEEIQYYYGFDTLVKLSNNNIEQFLGFAADLFDEMLSAKIVGNNIQISSDVQAKRIKKGVDNRWNELSKKISFGRSVINFIEKFADYAKKETYKPNAPIITGVTGFALSKSTQRKLFDKPNWYENEYYEPLLNVLSTCVSNNLLEPRIVTQGKVGEKNKVFYLNRWICIKFGLPLSYGGWKSKQVDELLQWTKI